MSAHGLRAVRLGDFVELVRGVSYSKSDAKLVPFDGSVPILRATNIDGELDFDDLVHVPERYVRPEQIMRPGDVVVATSSGSRSVVGKAAPLRHDWHGSFGAFCMVVRPCDGLVPAYLAHFMQSRAYRDEVSGLAAGIGIHNLRRSHLEELRIPLPSEAAQAQIAAYLDEQFSRLDAARIALLRARHKAKSLRSSLWRQAAAPSPDDMPAWRRVRLPDITFSLDSRRVPVNARERAERHGDVPYYGATGRVGWIDRPLFDEELVLLGEDGAPFLNPTAPKAYRIEGPAWVNNHAHVLRAVEAAVSAKYLVLALNAFDYSDHVNGTTRLKLTKSAMNRIEIALPSRPQQDLLVSEYEARISMLETVAASIERNSLRARAMGDSLLRDCLGGRFTRMTDA